MAKKNENINIFFEAAAWPDLPHDLELDTLSQEWRDALGMLGEDIKKTRRKIINRCATATKQELTDVLVDVMCAMLAKQELLKGTCISATSVLATLAQVKKRQHKGIEAKLRNDPKQAAKADARKLWNNWQTGQTLHKSQAAFARHVVDAFPVIENPKSVERWATQWRKEAQTKRQKQAPN